MRHEDIKDLERASDKIKDIMEDYKTKSYDEISDMIEEKKLDAAMLSIILKVHSSNSSKSYINWLYFRIKPITLCSIWFLLDCNLCLLQSILSNSGSYFNIVDFIISLDGFPRTFWICL